MLYFDILNICMYNRFIICMYSVIESILFVINLDNSIINIKCIDIYVLM